MSRGDELASFHAVSPGEVAQRFGGQLADGDLPELVRALHAQRGLNEAGAAAHVGGADEFDVMHREDAVRHRFASVVGRPPALWEIAGPAVAGCVACARMGSGCEAHARRPGEPIPFPPRPWPSDPGPDDGKHAPYRLDRSVA